MCLVIHASGETEKPANGYLEKTDIQANRGVRVLRIWLVKGFKVSGKWTFRPIDFSTYGLVDISTFRLFDKWTFRYLDRSSR